MRISELLEANDRHISKALAVLSGHDDWIPEAIEIAAAQFDTFNELLADAGLTWADDEVLRRAHGEASLTDQQLTNAYKGDDDAGLPGEAGAAIRRIRHTHLRLGVALMIGRCYRWAATDLLRFRITAAIANLRVQAEGVALLLLFRDGGDPESRGWYRAATSDAGRLWYKANQRRLRAQMNEGIGFAYDYGSMALHVRPLGFLRSVSMGGPHDALRLLDQEVNPDNMGLYVREALNVLICQTSVWHGMLEAFPEVHDKVAAWAATAVAFAERADVSQNRLSAALNRASE